jgi:hypothetical protein
MKPTSEGTYIALALLALNAIWASFAPTTFNAAFALLVFLALVPSVLRSAPAYVVAMSPLLFYWTTELLSGIAIEGGAFMVETDATGSPTGAFARLALIYAALFLAGRQVWRTDPLQSVAIPQTKGFMGEGVIIFASFALIGSFFLFGALNGFPLLEGIDRYAYRRGIGSDALTSFLDNKTIYFTLIGMAAASGRYRRAAAALFVLGISISLLYGEKFTTIVEGFLFFFIPVILQRFAVANPLPLRQLAYGGAAAIAVTVPAILINYGALYDFETAIYQLAARASLQGQLWFLVDRDYGHLLALNAESIAAAVRSLYTLSEQSQFVAGTSHGMYFVMEPYTDVEKLYWTMYAGGGFIFAHFPYWLMVSGYAGMLLVGLLTVLTLSWVTKRTVLALRHTDPISLVIWLKVLVWIYAGFVLGNFWFFYGVKTLVLILAACLWDALAAAMRQRNAPEVEGTSTRAPKLIRRVA